MDKRIHIPSIYASQQFEELLGICHPLLNDPMLTKVVLDFSQCKFLAHHATAVLGGIAHYLKVDHRFLTLDLETVSPRIRVNLAQNGLLNYLGHNDEPWDGNSIPFRHDLTFDRDGIINYLKHSWLGKGLLNISENLKNLIIGQVLEIYLNGFEHSRSELGVFSCGQYYPTKKRLKLTILDMGVGIPENVRNFRETPTFPAEDAMRWAFQQGSSTQPLPNTARGIGLDNVRSFISTNQGKLQIYSHDAFVKITANDEQYGGQNTPFKGTIVNIDIACDSKYYCLSSELSGSTEPLF
jgi:hypothetical protein